MLIMEYQPGDRLRHKSHEIPYCLKTQPSWEYCAPSSRHFGNEVWRHMRQRIQGERSCLDHYALLDSVGIVVGMEKYLAPFHTGVGGSETVYQSYPTSPRRYTRCLSYQDAGSYSSVLLYVVGSLLGSRRRKGLQDSRTLSDVNERSQLFWRIVNYYTRTLSKPPTQNFRLR